MEVEVACTRCRYRKTRCCGSRPSCQTCLKFKKECVYVSIEDSRTAPRGVYVPELSGGIRRTDKRRSLTLLSEAEGGSEAVVKAGTSVARDRSVGLISSTKAPTESTIPQSYETSFSTHSSSVPSTYLGAYEKTVEFELGGYVEPGVFFHNQPAQSGIYEVDHGSTSSFEPATYPPIHQSSPSEILTFPTTRCQLQLQQTNEPIAVPEPYLKTALELQQMQVNHTLTSYPTTYCQPTSVSLPEYTQKFASTTTHPLHVSNPCYTCHPLKPAAGEPFVLEDHKCRQSPVLFPLSVSTPPPMLSTNHIPSHPILPPREEPLGVVGWNPDPVVPRDVRSDEHPDEALAWEDLLR